MRARRKWASAIATLMLLSAGLFGSTTPAAAATYQGGATFKTWGWVLCADGNHYTEIDATIYWAMKTVVLHGGVYWALSPLSAMVEINDPGPIRADCHPYLMTRVFNLKDIGGTVIASNQTAVESMSYPNCITWLYDTNYFTMAYGCHHGTYYFKYTHPAGYIFYGASVLPNAGLGMAGNTGWRSLGG